MCKKIILFFLCFFSLLIDAQDQKSDSLDLELIARDHIGTYRYIGDRKHLERTENEKIFLLEKALSRIQYWRKRAVASRDLEDLHRMLNRPGLTEILKTFDAVINTPLIESSQHLPITITLLRRDNETALALMEAGADIKKSDRQGVPVIVHAMINKVLPFAEQVIRNDPSVLYESLTASSPVFSLICSDSSYMPLLQAVIELTNKINHPQFFSYSLMAHTLASNNKIGALTLLENGSYVDMKEFSEDVLSPYAIRLCREMLEYQDSSENKLSFAQAVLFVRALALEKKVELTSEVSIRKILESLYEQSDGVVQRYKIRQSFERCVYSDETKEEAVLVPMISSVLVIDDEKKPEVLPVSCVKNVPAVVAREPLTLGFKKDEKNLFVHSEFSAFKRV